jgi:hypothetical protein
MTSLDVRLREQRPGLWSLIADGLRFDAELEPRLGRYRVSVRTPRGVLDIATVSYLAAAEESIAEWRVAQR